MLGYSPTSPQPKVDPQNLRKNPDRRHTKTNAQEEASRCRQNRLSRIYSRTNLVSKSVPTVVMESKRMEDVTTLLAFANMRFAGSVWHPIVDLKE